MIAISIFAVLGLGAYRLLNGEIHVQARLQEHSGKQQQWQRGLRKLQQDLLQISPRPIRANYGEPEAAFIGESDNFTFTHSGWHNPLQHNRSHLQRVHYRLGQQDDDRDTLNEDQGQQLLREYWQVLDRAPNSEPHSQRLLDAIDTIELRYLDDKGKWHSRWPVTVSNADNISSEYPLALEIRIDSLKYGEITRLFALSGRISSNNNDSGVGG